MAAIPLWQYARHTQPGSSHHQAFWNALDDALTAEQRARIAPGGDLRGIWEAAAGEAAPAAPAADWMAACLPLIKQFEGCRLQAYPDPGTGGDPWTIGWGTTTVDGKPVRQGDTITQARADQLLAADVTRTRAAVLQLLPMLNRWTAAQQAALVSFAYNVGAGALEASTLRKRLLAGEDPATVVQQELPRWNKGGSGPMEGLSRRRAAEVALFVGGQPVAAPRVANPLAGFPFFPQQDNGPEGWRQCQTSAVGMCLAYLKVPGIRDDLDYLRVVQRYGDTTIQQTHVLALKSLGVRARFRQNMTAGELQAEIRADLPAAIGVLHHGPVSAPSGGGHYIAVHGFTDDAWIVNDPYGELDLLNGGWSSQAPTAGKGQRYSFRNLNPRWLPEGPASGWGWVFS